MEAQNPDKYSTVSQWKVERSLLTIDSSIRNGQFVYALRETNKLLSELKRGDLSVGEKTDPLIKTLKMTSVFLKPMVAAYSQNQCSLGIIKNKYAK